MAKFTLKELQDIYLIKLYEFSKGVAFQTVETEKLKEALNLTDEEIAPIIVRLKERRLAKFTFGSSYITADGVEEVEKIMAETYEENEYRVLKAIYDLSDAIPQKMILIEDLHRIIGIDYPLLLPILHDLEKRKGLIGSINEAVCILPAGVEGIEQTNSNSSANITYNNNTFNAPVGAFQQNTQNSSQNVNQSISVTNNADFNSAIASILDLVKESSLVNFKKEDLITEIQRIKILAENAPSPELVEHAKSKINYLETAIKATDLVTKISHFIPQLYAYFDGLLK